MLEKVDLEKNLAKEDYKNMMSQLELKIGEIQRQARKMEIPVMIVFEGWDASGKGSLLNTLILSLDPRGFNVHSINDPTEEEKSRPFLHRFWTKLPSRGRWAIYEKSWYRRVLEERLYKEFAEKEVGESYHEINSFERMLVNDGAVIIKLFLHISQKEQKKRFEELKRSSTAGWLVMKKDFNQNKHYQEYLHLVEEMIQRTDTAAAPWIIVEAHDRKFAGVKIFTAIIRAIEAKIQEKKTQPNGITVSQAVDWEWKSLNSSMLDKVDLSKSLTKEEYEEQLKEYQEHFRNIQYELHLKQKPMLILYEGWDASGKGSNIKRLTQNLDPRGYVVVPVASPNDWEKNHHYLWRFWNIVPKAGQITILDRSWYGRVLVERVEGFCREEEWKRAYKEINEMEEQLVSFGTVLIKFWLHIDQEEQLKRFQEREATPYKQWKITEEDWRNREKWELYREAVDEMLFRTSTTYAPWTIVESNSKYYARIKTLKTVIEAAKKVL